MAGPYAFRRIGVLHDATLLVFTLMFLGVVALVPVGLGAYVMFLAITEDQIMDDRRFTLMSGFAMATSLMAAMCSVTISVWLLRRSGHVVELYGSELSVHEKGISVTGRGKRRDIEKHTVFT